MARRKFRPYTIENLEVTNAGSEGKCIARHDDKVVMIDFAVPGDVADVRVNSTKKSFSMATIERLIKPSEDRVDTFCQHFGICGGCKTQQMSYAAQIKYKQQQVVDAFERLGKFPFSGFEPIIGSENTTYYRNKCEFNFIDRKWVTNKEDLETLGETNLKGVGYHLPGRFDKIFDVETCYLQHEVANKIRNGVREFGKQHNYPFFNPYSQEGYLRNIILRNNMAGDWMVILCISKPGEDEKRTQIMEYLRTEFPEIKSLYYVINTKMNDTIYDLTPVLYSGDEYLVEELEGLKFQIGPKSFFQVNIPQTQNLYAKARELAQLTGNENVYDLYTGVGSIALFVSRFAKQVIGIENVEEAIVDAQRNANLNGITNTHFYAGDMKDVLNDELIAKHGKPDVIITDPPRAGMHPDVIETILKAEAQKVVYVSCNPATQARDIAMMQEKYTVTRVQPVDMFPHTHHVENIALLELKK
jgi:23S rRNA (uracil1939-C5)-methyltransferase